MDQMSGNLQIWSSLGSVIKQLPGEDDMVQSYFKLHKIKQLPHFVIKIITNAMYGNCENLKLAMLTRVIGALHYILEKCICLWMYASFWYVECNFLWWKDRLSILLIHFLFYLFCNVRIGGSEVKWKGSWGVTSVKKKKKKGTMLDKMLSHRFAKCHSATLKPKLWAVSLKFFYQVLQNSAVDLDM